MIPQQCLMRTMGGGPRNPEHTARLRVLKRARKAANKLRGPKPPKEPPSRDLYNRLAAWKDKPVSPKIVDVLPHLEHFIAETWLERYPMGAHLRKLQRDMAFRMERQHRPGLLPYEVLMPVLGRLERKGIVKMRMGGKGDCVVYSPNGMAEAGKDGTITTKALGVDTEESNGINDA